MQVKIEHHNNEVSMEIIGRLDTITAPELEDVLNQYQNTKIILNFKNVEYISSAGLRVLLSTFKRLRNQNGVLQIINPNESVMEVFEITGFKKIFQL